MMNTDFDVLIIGCGVIGSAAAYELSKYDLKIGVLERFNDVANGATKANSAILHAGFDAKPGTLMAELNVKSVPLVKQLSRKLGFKCVPMPSLVIATTDDEMKTVKELYDRGNVNGTPGLRILDKVQAHAVEPSLSDDVIGALYAPSSAILDPWGMALALAETAVVNGTQVMLEHTVTGIKKSDDGIFTVSTDKGDYTSRYVVNAAGCFAPDIDRMVGDDDLIPSYMRGQYFVLDKSEGTRVHSVVFQCPSKLGKGVLVAPTVHGNLIVGPDAIPVSDGDAVGTDPKTLNLLRNLSKKSVPGIDFRQIIHEYAGVRPNTNVDDFTIEMSKKCPDFVRLSGIKSPGLSSAPAIAQMCADILRDGGLELREKSNFTDERKNVIFRELDGEQKKRLLAENPLYGRVICRCETVTEAEIVAAIHSPIPPRTVDGIKRRCGAGMGRCQGGFCRPRVHEILSRELGVDMKDILMDEQGSWILCGDTKEDGLCQN